ncbi:predicted membrane protein [Anaerolinea thermolimosa]|nr:predicted membrane protein [Anaerolinea thermolimosa]
MRMCLFGFGGWNTGFGWIGMVLNLVFTLVVILGVVFLVVWTVRRVSGPHLPAGSSGQGALSAKEIAQLRYARGEISREEYQQILSDLNH